jgi:hypothetical protein
VGNRVPKGPRKRGDTVTSVRTATTRRDSIGTARSGSSAKHPEEVRTPTRAETNPSAVKKVSSDVNPPPPPPSKTTTTTVTTIAKNDDYDDDASVSEVATATTDQPTTPALTPALTGTTDDSDTDFQSAYSKTPSPRESLRGNFDGSTEGGDTFPGAAATVEKTHIPGSFEGAEIARKRVSSVATAVAQPSPTFSDETVVSRLEGSHPISRR